MHKLAQTLIQINISLEVNYVVLKQYRKLCKRKRQGVHTSKKGFLMPALNKSRKKGLRLHSQTQRLQTLFCHLRSKVVEALQALALLQIW